MTLKTDSNGNIKSDLEEMHSTLINENNVKVFQSRKSKWIAKYLCISIVAAILLLLFLVFLAFTDTAKPLRCLFDSMFGLDKIECQRSDILESLHMDLDGQNNMFANSTNKVSLCNDADKTGQANCSIQTDNIELTPQQVEYMATAEKTWQLSWEIMHDKKIWTKLKGDSLETGRVYSKNYKDLGTVFKLEAYVDLDPYSLFKWESSLPDNPMVETLSVIANITQDIDIVYTHMKPVAGGLISSRDSVVLRHYKSRGNKWLASCSSIDYPGAPSYPNVIRGTSVSGYLYAPVEGDQNKCLCVWFSCGNPGGWIPKWLLNRQAPISMMDNLRSIRERIRKSKETQTTIKAYCTGASF